MFAYQNAVPYTRHPDCVKNQMSARSNNNRKKNKKFKKNKNWSFLEKQWYMIYLWSQTFPDLILMVLCIYSATDSLTRGVCMSFSSSSACNVLVELKYCIALHRKSPSALARALSIAPHARAGPFQSSANGIDTYITFSEQHFCT